MATATYQTTTDAGQEPDHKAVSTVSVDEKDVHVTWWPSLLTQTDPLFTMSKSDVKTYLETEALWATGNYDDARNHLSSLATGTDTRPYDANGVQTGGTHGRNWAQRWIH